MKRRVFSLLLLSLLMLSCGSNSTSVIGKTMPSKAVETKLPHSMKGYELYSWQTYNIWHFTLITGTNRLKGIEEITSGDNSITPDGWVRVSVEGIDAIKAVLSRLPQHEAIFWINRQWLERVHTQIGDIVLPPKEIIDDLKQYCKELDLELQY
jgi:hypothetical protein